MAKAKQKQIKIGLLGAGTVGGGVILVLNQNRQLITERVGAEICIQKVLARHPEKVRALDASLATTDKIEDIVNDPEIDIVVELMGREHPALEYMEAALRAGKNVVTANKDVVATHGKELFELAAANHVDFLFEAAVAGGIPIIRPLKESLAANKINKIMGIINGTTNYMLYKMSTENCDFDTVLKEAQAKGYAEADPTADVEGADACRKIAILSSLAYGKFLNYENIYTEGITKITPADMEYAKELGMTIKLLATSRRIGDAFYAMVAPFLVGQESPLYSVNDVFNAVFVHGNVLGDAMFYGSGAGKLPTASAVVADVVDEAKHLHRNIMTNWSSRDLELMDLDDVEGRFFVRVSDTTMDEVEKAFGDVQTIEPDNLPEEFGFITPKMKQADYKEKISKLDGKVLAMIRVKD